MILSISHASIRDWMTGLNDRARDASAFVYTPILITVKRAAVITLAILTIALATKILVSAILVYLEIRNNQILTRWTDPDGKGSLTTRLVRRFWNKLSQ